MRETHNLNTLLCLRGREVSLWQEFVPYWREMRVNWEYCGCCWGWKKGRHRDVYTGQHYVMSARGASEGWQMNSAGSGPTLHQWSGHVACPRLLSRKTWAVAPYWSEHRQPPSLVLSQELRRLKDSTSGFTPELGASVVFGGLLLPTGGCQHWPTVMSEEWCFIHLFNHLFSQSVSHPFIYSSIHWRPSCLITH